MGVGSKAAIPSKRRVANVRHFTKDKYHPDCYKSQEDTKTIDEGDGKKKSIIGPTDSNKEKKVVFDKDTFEKLKRKSQFLTPEERKQLMAQVKAEKEQKEMESALRKKELQDCEQSVEYGSRLTEVEEEAARKAQHLLARAHELRQEQEDEVKRCNALILATKCHAIRDAQVAEKKLIEKELAEEEKRLEEMMERERQEALRAQERQKELQKMKKQQYVKTVLEQIQENELQREMQAERIEEESRLANEAAMQVQLDELKVLREKLAAQARQREEMNKINQQLHHYACLEKEEGRLADLKVQEYMRRKAEVERAREQEHALQRLEKEKELARLRAMQKRAADTQAAKDEMNAMRIQDEVERAWRKKEREAAMARARKAEELRIAREQQILDRRKCQAIEIQREKEEMERIARVNREEQEKQKLEEQRRLCMLESHRMELLKQIGEKEKQKIKARQQQFEEGLAVKVEKQKREDTLKETMAKKMNMIRSHNVPEKYVREVERQLQLI
ncbi:cilia- and flagella-associated protein 45-like [Macrosteles quadrilineatus]|uniref:cilia- and flagella-associated protein 45-like n=1 Tax=Macrosteles quadrilineatus TaxID=74068 RepID=UPI0023E0E5E7|nr:cilia- and flagella-associated protein 45-like [Macrosteles quadrilineatus]